MSHSTEVDGTIYVGTERGRRTVRGILELRIRPQASFSDCEVCSDSIVVIVDAEEGSVLGYTSIDSCRTPHATERTFFALS